MGWPTACGRLPTKSNGQDRLGRSRCGRLLAVTRADVGPGDDLADAKRGEQFQGRFRLENASTSDRVSHEEDNATQDADLVLVVGFGGEDKEKEARRFAFGGRTVEGSAGQADSDEEGLEVGDAGVRNRDSVTE